MKILYVYDLYRENFGENLWVQSEPDLFANRGHEVVVYRRDNREIQTFPFWKKVSLLWQTSWSRESYEAVRSLVRIERPELVHVYNTLPLVTPAVYYACREEGVPVVQTLYNYRLLCPAATFLRDGKICEQCVEHSLWRSVGYGCYRNSRLQTAAVAWMLASHRRSGTWRELVDLYIVPTRFMRDKLIASGLPAERVVIKPNYHEPDPGIREASDGSLLYVGKLNREKGLLTLLAAWRMLSNPPTLRIIGDGPNRKEVEEAAANQPTNKIDFLGRQPHHKVISYMKKTAAFILPSQWYEAFPHVILEAFACGVPIIGSRIGTLVDVIEDGETGVLFEPGQAADLAAKITWILDNSRRAVQMGKAGRAKFETEYTADRNYDRLLNIYASVAKLRTRRQLAAEVMSAQ